MLRAALETLGRGFVIVDVPSAEEAQLEFRRGPVDLLITDLRLPGISGLELIRRMHKSSSAARMIVISGYADETAQAEFRSLGAMFFPKPLDLEAFLKGVQAAVGAREPAAPSASHPSGEQPGIAERLERLRRDLGALSAFLLDAEGHIAVQAGEAANLDLPALLPHLKEAFQAALRVSQALGGQTPGNVQFFEGSALAVYAANVGAHFSLVLVFDGQRGGGQMGPVLRYGRQAADDLLNALRKMGVEGGQYPPPAAPAPPARRPKTGPLRKKTAPLSKAAPKAAATAQTAPAKNEPVTPEALRALDTAVEKTNSQDAAKFWEGVDGSQIGDTRTGTLSWEEAAKLGLVPPKTPPEK